MDNTETDTETATGHLDIIYVYRHGHRRDRQRRHGQRHSDGANDGRRSCDCLTRQLRCSVAATTLLVEREVERGETCEKHLEKRPG